MKQTLVIGSALIIFVMIISFVFKPDNSTPAVNDENTATQTEPSNIQEKPDKQYIRIAATGDMLPHETVNLRAKTTNGYDYKKFLEPVSEFVSSSDIVFCNQESPSAGEALGISGYPTFNAPIEFSRDLSDFGCNLINLANNHIGDYGQTGIDLTLDTWASLKPLAISGANSSLAEQNKISYFEIQGKKFAFIAFTDLSNNKSLNLYSVNMFDEELVTRLASEASKNADFVIASAHWGVEYSEVVSQSQIDWANLLVDNGVDLIIGTGPHVLQPVDKIKDSIVFYSLGNLLSTQLTIEQLIGGIAYIDIPIDANDNDPIKLSFVPTYMHYEWTSEQAAREDFLARDNLKVIPLDQAANELSKSLFNTDAEQQLSRVKDILNRNQIKVEVISSIDFN